MAKRWLGLQKLTEECGELVVELMKLSAFPSGKHPGRRRNVKLTTEEEVADVYAALDYFVARNKLDRDKIKKRRLLKIKKFVKWWGNPNIKPEKVSGKALGRVGSKGSKSPQPALGEPIAGLPGKVGKRTRAGDGVPRA